MVRYRHATGLECVAAVRPYIMLRLLRYFPRLRIEGVGVMPETGKPIGAKFLVEVAVREDGTRRLDGVYLAMDPWDDDDTPKSQSRLLLDGAVLPKLVMRRIVREVVRAVDVGECL